MIPYKNIEIADKPIFDYFFSLKPFENSEFTFTNLFIWRHNYNIQHAVIDDHLCIAGRYEGDLPFIFPPIGKDSTTTGDVLLKMIEDYKQKGYPIIIKGMTQDYKELFELSVPGLLEYSPDPDNFDYVYLSQDLIKLEGRKYHSKRNHINRFIKNYEYKYEPICVENIEECIIAEIEWSAERRGDRGLEEERAAIIEALRNFDYLKLKGGALRINDKIEAFSIGQLLNPEMAVIHIEKANVDYRGCYTAINQQFAEHAWSDTLYINREEDMGIEGLRKSKLSYYPIKMVKKYTGLLKNHHLNHKLHVQEVSF